MRSSTPHRRAGRRRPAATAAALIGALVLSLTAGLPSAAAADDPARLTWSIQPATAQGIDARPWFASDVAPGTARVEYVGVSNYGDAPLTLDLYAADGLTNPDGSFALRTRSDAATDVATWISLKQSTVTVPARSRTDVPFSITVPADATPGDHVGGIVAALTTPATGADGNSVALEQRVGTRVYLRVAGEVRPAVSIEGLDTSYAAALDPMQGGTTTVRYTVRNTGNVRVGVEQALAVAGVLPLGSQDAAVPTITEIAPGGAVEVSVEVATPTPLLRATAEVVLTPTVLGAATSGALPAVTASASTWAVPWSQLVALLLVVVLAYLLACAVRRRRERREAGRAAELAAAREQGRADAHAHVAATRSG